MPPEVILHDVKMEKSSVKISKYVKIFSIHSMYSCVLSAIFGKFQNIKKSSTVRY